MSGDKQPETITPISPSLAVHRDGDHECVVGYEGVQQGEDLRGKAIWSRRQDGTYEHVMGGPLHGPAQVASPAYRESWERTFGRSTGGVS